MSTETSHFASEAAARLTIMATLLSFSLAMSSRAVAAPCKAVAARIAKDHSRRSAILQEVERLKSSKANLESYGVTFINGDGDPSSITSLVVTLSKQGCAPVSVIPR